MINYGAIENASLITKPFTYAVINNLFNYQTAQLLREFQPKEDFFRSVRLDGSDKTYNVVNKILFKLETAQESEEKLSPSWDQLLTCLTGDIYRSALSKMLGLDLSACYQEITLKVYGKDDYLSFHTDKSDVKATHMIFLNEEWSSEWGGELLFSNTPEEEPFIKFIPVWDQSVVFVRSENSWHAVTKIKNDQAKRLALQVAFWNVNTRTVLPGRLEEKLNDNY